MSYYRRSTTRTEADQNVYAFWSSAGPGDLSLVRNLSLGGIFIETSARKEVGAPIDLYFLVLEGQIHARAVVRHAGAGCGLGLKFINLDGQDRLHFVALMKRLYTVKRALAGKQELTGCRS